MLVDVHAHLDFFKEDELNQVIKNAEEAGIIYIINTGINSKTNRKALALAKKFKLINAALGIYPSNAIEMPKSEINREIKFIEASARKNKKIIAIGEVGLDFTKAEKEEKEKQILIFKKFIKLAKKLKLPIIVHSRKAEQKTISILKQEKAYKVIMHCFKGDISLTQELGNNFYFSIPVRVVTDIHFQELVRAVGLGQLLTETDSPFLGIEKGKRNEPANISLTIKKISELKGITKNEVEGVIFANFKKLFM